MNTHRIDIGEILARPDVRRAQRWIRVRRWLAANAWWWGTFLATGAGYLLCKN